MKEVKKVIIYWEDEEGNKCEVPLEVGDTREYGEYLHCEWEIKRIKVIK